MSTVTRTRRDELLDAAVAHVVEHGYADLSFRTLAVGLGVHHNSLTHHFGSRADLTVAIFSRLRELSKMSLALDDPDARPSDLLRLYWAEATRPDGVLLWTSFFEFYAHALRERGSLQDYLTEVTQAWVEPLSERAEAAGLGADDALSMATLITATVRGLLLDRIGAEDPARVDRAFEMFVSGLNRIPARK